MTEMGIETISDIAKWVPNFNASETAFGPPVYTMRGVGFNESSPQATSTVGVYVDQIAIPYPIMTKGVNLDLERVEVLKGPQGTLYGRNATAGAVNYITAKPTKEFEARILASYGSFQTYSVEGFASGGLTDNVLARLAVRTVQSNKGWQESISRDERLGEQDKVAARLSFAFLLGADTDILFKIAYNKDKSDRWSISLAKRADYPLQLPSPHRFIPTRTFLLGMAMTTRQLTGPRVGAHVLIIKTPVSL